MNEKIKELAEQSGFFPVPNETETDWEYRAENARYEKFAELIINECLDIVDKEVLGMVGVNAMKKIEEHFGIVE